MSSVITYESADCLRLKENKAQTFPVSDNERTASRLPSAESTTAPHKSTTSAGNLDLPTHSLGRWRMKTLVGSTLMIVVEELIVGVE